MAHASQHFNHISFFTLFLSHISDQLTDSGQFHARAQACYEGSFSFTKLQSKNQQMIIYLP